MKRESKLIIALLLLLLLIMGGVRLITGNRKPHIQSAQSFIVANPIDLTKIQAISKYRSCVGHDYSGESLDGAKETHRSMKHYVEIKKTANEIAVFAPFDGTVASVDREQSGKDSQVWIRSREAPRWYFIFFHINLLPNFEEGSTVQAGEQIGVAKVQVGGNFDIALKYSAPFSPLKLASPFSYFAQNVFAEYAAQGVTKENIIITQADRDREPCPIANSLGRDVFFAPGYRSSDWVTLAPSQN